MGQNVSGRIQFCVDWVHALLGNDESRFHVFRDGFIRQIKLQQRSHGGRNNTVCVLSSVQFCFKR